ncbi:MAG: hypothetical protein ACPGSB_07600 [Opitutales bacterium]
MVLEEISRTQDRNSPELLKKKQVLLIAAHKSICLGGQGALRYHLVKRVGHHPTRLSYGEDRFRAAAQ